MKLYANAAQVASMQSQPPARPRLLADDFVALRSLSKSLWHQDRDITWKVKGKWRAARHSVASLDAVDRLVAMGLAEDTVCGVAGCGRAVFQLTDRGKVFVSRMDSIAQAVNSRQLQKVLDMDGAKVGWFGRLWRALSAG